MGGGILLLQVKAEQSVGGFMNTDSINGCLNNYLFEN